MMAQRAYDNSRRAAQAIRMNLAGLKIEEGFEVLEREAATAIRLLEAQGVVCDFCFLDPPYRQMADYERTLGLLAESRLLKPQSVVIAEHDKHFDPGESFGRLRRHRKLQQGDAVLSFYGLEEP